MHDKDGKINKIVEIIFRLDEYGRPPTTYNKSVIVAPGCRYCCYGKIGINSKTPCGRQENIFIQMGRIMTILSG